MGISSGELWFPSLAALRAAGGCWSGIAGPGHVPGMRKDARPLQGYREACDLRPLYRKDFMGKILCRQAELQKYFKFSGTPLEKSTRKGNAEIVELVDVAQFS